MYCSTMFFGNTKTNNLTKKISINFTRSETEGGIIEANQEVGAIPAKNWNNIISQISLSNIFTGWPTTVNEVIPANSAYSSNPRFASGVFGNWTQFTGITGPIITTKSGNPLLTSKSGYYNLFAQHNSHYNSTPWYRYRSDNWSHPSILLHT